MPGYGDERPHRINGGEWGICFLAERTEGKAPDKRQREEEGEKTRAVCKGVRAESQHGHMLCTGQRVLSTTHTARVLCTRLNTPHGTKRISVRTEYNTLGASVTSYHGLSGVLAIPVRTNVPQPTYREDSSTQSTHRTRRKDADIIHSYYRYCRQNETRGGIYYRTRGARRTCPNKRIAIYVS